LRVGPLVLACPLGALEVSLAGHAFIPGLLPGFLLLTLLLFATGRAWCGWVCPARLAGNALAGAGAFLAPGAAAAIGKSKRKLSARGRFSPKREHALGFLLGLLLGAWIFRYPLWSVICPLGAVSRTLIEGSLFFRPRWDLVFLVLPLLGTLLFRAGWKCACPVGAVHGILAGANRSLLPGLSPATEKPCNQCGMCRRVCESGLDPAGDLPAFDCTKCLRCVEHCPRRCLRVRTIKRRF
jgi:ferredoxin-type protein NapH